MTCPSLVFSFYDQVHTTGMDIKQVLNARAVCTLGKDMTFRDHAQGTFRMRGIGQGQTIVLCVTPEINELVLSEVALAGGETKKGRAARLLGQKAHDHNLQFLNDVCAWLIINSMKTERTQFNLLCEQSSKNVLRKAARPTQTAS